MRSFMYAVTFAMTLGACGGGDDGKTVALVDAPTSTKKDAPTTNPTPDAPTTTAIMGLGQTCDQTHACPSSAMQCVTTSQGATSGFCTLACHTGATFMTDANAQPTDPNLGTTSADAAKCTAAYSAGSSGTANCDLPLNVKPAPTGGMLAKNTTYTYDAYCAIDCGGTQAAPTCPSGLTCDTSSGYCFP